MIEAIKKGILKHVKTQRSLKVGVKDFAYPENSEMGDISLPVFRFAKELKQLPNSIAEQFAHNLDGKIPSIERIATVNGYVNFFVRTSILAKKLIHEVLLSKEKFGNKKPNKKKVILEFISPNSNKPLHLGHLRNAALGEAVARLLETQGKKVTRANLVNDRGIHICKAMIAYKNFGTVVKESGGMITDSPEVSKEKGDHFVGRYYVAYEREKQKNPALEEEARECLVRWEAEDPEIRKLWKIMRSWVINGFKETYKTLGIQFDRFDYESDIWKGGKKIVETGLKKKVFTKEDNGAVIAKLDKFGLPDKILLRKDGTSIYITTDLYLAETRYKDLKFDEVVYVVASEQDLYFKQLFAVFKLLKTPYAPKTHHLSYGMVFLPEGKMKSREGTVIDADELVKKLQDYAKEEIKKRHDFLREEEAERRALVIALAAIKYYLLAVNPPSSMHFDPKESLAFTGKTGPYLLYTLARMRSILAKDEKRKTKKGGLESDLYRYLKTKEEKVLIIEMAKFGEVLTRGAETLDPEELATYLYSLAKKFSDFYEKHSVLDAPPEISKARLALVEALSIVTAKGLRTLGIETLDEM